MRNMDCFVHYVAYKKQRFKKPDLFSISGPVIDSCLNKLMSASASTPLYMRMEIDSVSEK